MAAETSSFRTLAPERRGEGGTLADPFPPPPWTGCP